MWDAAGIEAGHEARKRPLSLHSHNKPFLKHFKRMKKKLLCLLAALSVGLSATAKVVEGSLGEGIHWKADTETGVLSITGTGTITLEKAGTVPWAGVASSITSINVADGVTMGDTSYPYVRINQNGDSYTRSIFSTTNVKEPVYNSTTFFYMPMEYAEATTYTVPDGIRLIAAYAFAYNKGTVTSVTLPSSCEVIGVCAFQNATKIDAIYNTDNLKHIYDYAFSRCRNLEKIVLPDDVSIESPNYTNQNPFEGCDKLTVYNTTTFFHVSQRETGSYAIPDGIVKVAPYAFERSNVTGLGFYPSLKEIGAYAFSRCNNLKHIFIPGSIERIPSHAFYQSYNVDSVDIESGVKHIGDYAFYGCNLKVATIPASVDSIESDAFNDNDNLCVVNLSEGLKHIGDYAFYVSGSKSSLTVNKLPESVTSIGTFPFGTNSSSDIYNSTIFARVGNDTVSTYTIPAGIKHIAANAFQASSVSNIEIPSSVETIGSYAFSTVYNLTSMVIPESVKQLGDGVFINSVKLEHVTLPSTLQKISNNMFERCTALQAISIPASVNNIGARAFYNCSGLTSITFAGRVDTIGEYAFYGCDALTDMLSTGKIFVKCPVAATSCTIPAGTEEIADYAFANCQSLTALDIPSTVKKIGNSAFESCKINNTSFETYTLPAGLEWIGSCAFKDGNYTKITVPQSVRYMGGYVFAETKTLVSAELLYSSADLLYEGAWYPNQSLQGTFSGCSALKSVTLPQDIRIVGGRTFQDCTSLTSIDLPASVTKIEDYTFSGCTSLASITLPEKLETIGDHAFYGCSSLTSIDIPDYVRTIDDGAFFGCSQLTNIELPSSLQSLSYYVFSGTKITSLTIPAGVTSLYNVGSGADSLKYISVDIDNPNYSSYKGIVLNKDQTSLVSIPAGIEELELPATLKSLPTALGDYKKVHSLTLPYIGAKKNPGTSKTDAMLGAVFGGYKSGSMVTTTNTLYGVTITTYTYPYTATLPSSLKKLTIYADSITPRLIAYNDTTSINTQRLYVTQNSYSISGLDALDSLVLKTSTGNVDSNVFKLFTGLKHLGVSNIDVMKAGCLADLTNLESLDIPFAGAGSSTTAVNFGTLFTTTADDAKARITQKFEDGTSQTYYLPKNLTNLTLGDGLDVLPYGALYGCHILKTLTLPASLYMVGENALYGCAGLTDIYCKGADPASAYDNTFSGVRVSSCKLHVPANAGTMYQRSTGWEKFYNIEEEAPITVSVTKNIERAGVIYGNEQYQLGAVAELRAVANSGYAFSAWVEGTTVVSTDYTYSFTVEGSRSLIAVFSAVKNDNEVKAEATSSAVHFTWEAEEDAMSYTLNVYADAALTQLVGTISFDANGKPLKALRAAQSTLSATIDGLDASTNYYYRMTAFDNTKTALSQYTGSFATTDATAIETVEIAVAPVITTQPGFIVVSHAEAKPVSVYTTTGRLVARVMGTEADVQIPADRGLYIVRVGSVAVKAIVK